MLTKKRIPIKFMFQKIQVELLTITVFSLVIGYLDKEFIFLSIPLAAPTILGTAISLLLAFRTAQAYDRWWEARIIWGSIVNNSRTLIREMLTFLSSESELNRDRLRISAMRQIGWCYALGRRLREQSEIEILEKYLSPEDLLKVKHHKNIPNAILSLHSEEIRTAYQQGLINEFQQIQLNKTIATLCDCMGMCERIKTTVFPRTYSALLHWLIYVFAAMLPFSLMNYPEYVEESLNIILSSAFFLIEKTSVYIQDPFENKPTDIPVSTIAHTIENNLLQMIERDTTPAASEAETFYIL